MQQYDKIRKHLQIVGAKNSQPNIVVFCTVAGLKNNIGSSGSGTSVSDYIEKATKPVGNHKIVYDYKPLICTFKTLSVSNVKNHNSRPEIMCVSAEKSGSLVSYQHRLNKVQGQVKVK